MKDWQELDNELNEEGWGLMIDRHLNEWKALFYHSVHLMQSGKAHNLQEAVEIAYGKVMENVT